VWSMVTPGGPTRAATKGSGAYGAPSIRVIASRLLAGVLPIIPTPFRPDGSIAEDDFLACIDFAIAMGADGVVFPGIGSEVDTLTTAERERLVPLAGKWIAGRIPYVVGGSDPSAAVSASYVAHGAAAGAAAAMVAAPAQYGSDIAAHIAHFTEIAAATDLPLILQNASPPSGAGLGPEAVAAVVCAVPGIRYVKEETLPCGQNIGRILVAAGPRLDGVFGGIGGRFLIEELQYGAAGSMPALDLVDLHIATTRAWRDGEERRARLIFRDMLPLLTVQSVYRWHVTKRVLALRGVVQCVGVRSPGPVPDGLTLRDLETMLAEIRHLLTVYPSRRGAEAPPGGPRRM
jgi:4-hydroxy-tetrahydrodipicolinate synthase